MSNKDKAIALAYHLEGTCLSLEQGIDQLDLDPKVDWEDLILTENMELCGGCGWWHESCELEWSQVDNAGYCDQCFNE